MQGNHDVTLDSEQVASPRTTAAGLEAWLSGVHADVPHDESQPEIVDTPEPLPIAEPEPAEIGPVNAAEALVLAALTQGMFSSARKLTGPDGAELVADPERNRYYFESTSLKPLTALLQQPASAWAPIYSEALKTARATNTAQPLERLRWYAGLIATPGILSRKLSRSQWYKLSRWPETEREFPKHFRIAKAMLKEPATVDEIVTASEMPYEEVVDYINASFAGGRLAATVTNQGGETAQGSRRVGLIALLNKPLFAR